MVVERVAGPQGAVRGAVGYRAAFGLPVFHLNQSARKRWHGLRLLRVITARQRRHVRGANRGREALECDRSLLPIVLPCSDVSTLFYGCSWHSSSVGKSQPLLHMKRGESS